jgi:hypothetical protein
MNNIQFPEYTIEEIQFANSLLNFDEDMSDLEPIATSPIQIDDFNMNDFIKNTIIDEFTRMIVLNQEIEEVNLEYYKLRRLAQTFPYCMQNIK